VIADAASTLDASFIAALASVPAAAWSQWIGDSGASASPPRRTLAATFALPSAHGHAALCVLETAHSDGTTGLHQVAIRRWAGAAPADAEVLYQQCDADGSVRWTLASAWADPDLRAWLREALASGASLRSDEWEWIAAPEHSGAALRSDVRDSRQLTHRRHDVVIFHPDLAAKVYRRVTRGSQHELDLLRHLERVPSPHVASRLLGSATLLGPNGQRSASAALRDIVVHRLRRALGGDVSLQAAALDDIRAAGVITHELHAALGRPFEQGVLIGAVPATRDDVQRWVARALASVRAATAHERTLAQAHTETATTLELLPSKLQQFGAAAANAPGLLHRVHGNTRLDTILIAPPRTMMLVEFDGDASLPDPDRASPQSPWRDVSSVLCSVARAAADAAHASGGDEATYERAWAWEREARKAYLEGYATGAGAMHALIAIFELELAADQIAATVDHTAPARRAAVRTLQRLTRTLV
jgi:predicted trehalose synthase